jgi:hypothetical protein
VTPLEILAPKKIHTRKNLDPNPLETTFDPEQIIRKSQKKLSKIHIVSLERAFSLPMSEVKSLEDVPFVLKFEKFLVKSKSESDLSKTMFDINKFKYLSPIAPGVNSPNHGVNSPKASVSSQVSNPGHIPIRFMATRFPPLILLAQLHELPHNFSEIIKTYNEKGDITTHQHLEKFNDFVDLEEVDYEDDKMILFAQSFNGEVKKWFKGLATGSIPNFLGFEIVFLRKWEDKKNPLQLLTQYNSLKRDVVETV